MKKSLIIVVAIVAVVLLGNVLLASAQGGGNGGYWPMGPAMMASTGAYTGTLPFGGPGGMTGGWGHGRMQGYMMAAGGMHEQVWTAIAQKLGLTYGELVAAVQNGQTIQQLAESKGVSLDDLKQAALDAQKAALAELVKQGVLTQAQADWMLNRMSSMPMFNFDFNFGPGFGPGGCHGGQPGVPGGMMNGWRGGPRWAPPGGNNG